MKLIMHDHIRDWHTNADTLSQCLQSIGARRLDSEYVESVLGMPLHLAFVVDSLQRERSNMLRSPMIGAEGHVLADALDSIPFHSLCKGLFLPLSSMTKDRAGQLFGIETKEPPDTAGRQALVGAFLGKEIGLTFRQKIACILGDPFYGNRSGFRRDSLLRILNRTGMWRRREMLDRLAHVGDVAVLYAQSRPHLKADPPLTAAEVLETLRLVSGAAAPGRNEQFAILTSLFERCGKLEAYFLAKMLLRKAGFGFEYDGDTICRLIAGHFGADEGQVSHAVALTDTFHIIRLLEKEGPDGLRKITLQPLVPVRPALANGTVDEVKQFPVWVERKYDGIRLTLHKATDSRGGVLCGAYTRNRLDWLEMIPGLDATIKMIPAGNVIVDGELYGTVFDLDGVRPANVYEVYAALHGQPSVPVTMRFAAFDLLYCDFSSSLLPSPFRGGAGGGVDGPGGHNPDITGRPLFERRQMLQTLLMPLLQTSSPFGGGWGEVRTPIAVTVVEGQLAGNKDDLNKLFHHFRAQGYEGIVSKDPNGPYRLGMRDPSWLKRKPEITLDLVLLGAVMAVTAKENVGRFGSYVIGARAADGTFVDVGDVAGVDRERDTALYNDILRDGLFTGRQIERQSASGVRPGYELRPGIVITVRFEGIMRESSGKLALRDPKLLAIRSDKNPGEADLVTALEEIYLRQRVG